MPPTKLSQLDAYTSPWLKAADLQGRAHRLTVDRVKVEEIRQPDGEKEAKIVIAFIGAKKKLIVNKTQALTLADLAKTEEFAKWEGLTVILEPAKTPNGKDTINIRPAPPKPAAQSTAATPAGAADAPPPTPSTPPAPVTQGKLPTADDDNPFYDDEPHGMPSPKGIANAMTRGPGFAG